MSYRLQMDVPTSPMSCFVTAYNTNGAMYKSPGVKYASLTEAFLAEIVTKGLAVWIARFPDATTLSLQAAAQSASLAQIAAYNPQVPGAIEFTITSTNPPAIPDGSSDVCTTTLTLSPNPSWTGTVTFSFVDLSGNGITGVFSPTTRTTAGNTTCTVSVPSLVATGSYDCAIVGTDTNGISDEAIISVSVL